MPSLKRGGVRDHNAESPRGTIEDSGLGGTGRRGLAGNHNVESVPGERVWEQPRWEAVGRDFAHRIMHAKHEAHGHTHHSRDDVKGLFARQQVALEDGEPEKLKYTAKRGSGVVPTVPDVVRNRKHHRFDGEHFRPRKRAGEMGGAGRKLTTARWDGRSLRGEGIFFRHDELF